MPQKPQVVNFIANYALGVGPIVTVAGTTPTLANDQKGKYLRTSSGSAVTYTVPKNDDVNIPIESAFNICQGGAGQVSITPDSGVTINSAGGLLDIAAQFGVVTLVKIAEDEWDLFGNLA